MNARLIQIIRMLAGGPKHPEEIADRLGLSPITARRHIQRLRKKGYSIELDASGRYYVLGKDGSGRKGMVGMEYGKRIGHLQEEMEKAAYRYVLEGAVSGMMGSRTKGEMVRRFTPSDVAEFLGVDEEVAESVLGHLEEAGYLRRFKSGTGPVYCPSEEFGIFQAFRRGLVDYTEEDFAKLISKQRFVLPKGVALQMIASREEELPEGGTRFEIYSNTGLNLIQDLTEGFLGLALDAQGSDFRRSMPEIPDDEMVGIEPESDMLSRFLTEFRPLNPWPWLWLMDLRQDMPEAELRSARTLFWSRAMRFLLILLRPIYTPLCELGIDGCTKMTEERMAEAPDQSRSKPVGRATDAQILKKSLEVMGPVRFWELSRALCLELLRSCRSVCRTLGISDEGTAQAACVIEMLETQQKTSHQERRMDAP